MKLLIAILTFFASSALADTEILTSWDPPIPHRKQTFRLQVLAQGIPCDEIQGIDLSISFNFVVLDQMKTTRKKGCGYSLNLFSETAGTFSFDGLKLLTTKGKLEVYGQTIEVVNSASDLKNFQTTASERYEAKEIGLAIQRPLNWIPPVKLEDVMAAQQQAKEKTEEPAARSVASASAPAKDEPPPPPPSGKPQKKGVQPTTTSLQIVREEGFARPFYSYLILGSAPLAFGDLNRPAVEFSKEVCANQMATLSNSVLVDPAHEMEIHGIRGGACSVSYELVPNQRHFQHIDIQFAKGDRRYFLVFGAPKPWPKEIEADFQSILKSVEILEQ